MCTQKRLIKKEASSKTKEKTGQNGKFRIKTTTTDVAII